MAMFLSAQGKHDEALAQLTPDVKRNGEVDADIGYSIGSVYRSKDCRTMLSSGWSVRFRLATPIDRVLRAIQIGRRCNRIRGLLN